MTAASQSAVPSVQSALRELLDSTLLLAEDWEALPDEARDDLLSCEDPEQVLRRLVGHGLLTAYQAERLRSGQTFGLVLGNYRVLDRLGVGGMSVVFRGEHVRMRRPVALKVVALHRDESGPALTRFLGEIRAVAQLRHPNIVAAFDAGEVVSPVVDLPVLHYFAMEYVPGQDLDDRVAMSGPLAPGQACDIAYQVAAALAEAHKHPLVHRDIKPSNILVTPEGQAKLLDFGLARRFHHRLTEPGAVLGTIEYVAPEQVRDASAVDARADVYGLGATMFWCLTGRQPFPSQGHLTQDLLRRLKQPAPSVRTYAQHLPLELDTVVSRMMASDPDDRYPTAEAVMSALSPFLPGKAPARAAPPTVRTTAAGPRVHSVLLADDEPEIRRLCRATLKAEGIDCDDAADGIETLEAVRRRSYDLVLLDIAMPRLSGLEVCRRLREEPPGPHLKVILVSGHATGDELAVALAAGADDFLTKPFSLIQLAARVASALRLKEAQDRSDDLTRQLIAVNQVLDQDLTARNCDLLHARNALVLALAKLVESRDHETGAHLNRLQRYVRCLAEQAATLAPFAGQIDDEFVRMLECCTPLHDIGKIALPDRVLLKPGRLDPEERMLMQTHTIVGAETLQEVARQHGGAVGFLHLAIDITRHHHERHDGLGYPDRLAAGSIPLAARLVAIGDVYDALRSRRLYKPPLSHASAVQVILEGSPGQFDPALVHAFQACHPQFEHIFREFAD
jgi:response regulator RpfG family c-di-GMP phosphodiesterase